MPVGPSHQKSTHHIQSSHQVVGYDVFGREDEPEQGQRGRSEFDSDCGTVLFVPLKECEEGNRSCQDQNHQVEGLSTKGMMMMVMMIAVTQGWQKSNEDRKKQTMHEAELGENDSSDIGSFLDVWTRHQVILICYYQ